MRFEIDKSGFVKPSKAMRLSPSKRILCFPWKRFPSKHYNDHLRLCGWPQLQEHIKFSTVVPAHAHQWSSSSSFHSAFWKTLSKMKFALLIIRLDFCVSCPVRVGCHSFVWFCPHDLSYVIVIVPEFFARPYRETSGGGASTQAQPLWDSERWDGGCFGVVWWRTDWYSDLCLLALGIAGTHTHGQQQWWEIVLALCWPLAIRSAIAPTT